MEIVMIRRPVVLCPIDFSEGCGGAVRYAAAIAEYFQSDLVIATVTDPLLNDVVAMTVGEGHLARESAHELERFYQETFARGPAPLVGPRFECAVGNPALEILTIATRIGADLIVMSSRGASDVRKMFFGSTAERVLRETTVPVLIAPPDGGEPARFMDPGKTVRRVLAAVDLSDASVPLARVAREIARAMDVPLVLLHVIEPVRLHWRGLRAIPSIASERRDRAERRLDSIATNAGSGGRVEALVVLGEPSEEIAKVAHDRDAGLIILGLHASPLRGPRMGSVTYRVLCLSHVPVLALPPTSTEGTTPLFDRRAVGMSEGRRTAQSVSGQL
jgi:nucleotide-binding universal stress UspA family protein